jgi:hypothetical protein
MRQFNRLVKQGNAIALAAKARAEAAESTLGAQQDEYLPYLLTQQTTLNAGRIQQSAAAKVVEQVYRAVKAWLYRTLSAHGFDGVASKLLQPKDITLLAERMIREMGNGTRPNTNSNQMSSSKKEQSQFDKLLAQADKMMADEGQLLAPNGKPSKLNRVQWAQVRTDNFKNWFGDWENESAARAEEGQNQGVSGLVARTNARAGGNAGRAWRLDSDTREPKTFFHGTKDDIEAFDLNHTNRKHIGWLVNPVFDSL